MRAPSAGQLGRQLVNVRVVGYGRRDQPDAGRSRRPLARRARKSGSLQLERLACPGQDALERLFAGRAVDITGQAEAAAAAAPARDLDQMHLAELGVGRIQARHRLGHRHVRDPQPLDLSGRVRWRGGVSGSAHRCRAGRSSASSSASRSPCTPSRSSSISCGSNSSASPITMASKKGASGSGLAEMPGPPGDQQGPHPSIAPLLLSRVLRRGGEGGEVPACRSIATMLKVVHLEGDGERPHIEFGHRRLRFQRHERADRLAAVHLPEDAFAHHIGLGVERAIEDLQRQARHADVVAVRVGQRNGELAAVILVDRAGFSIRARPSPPQSVSKNPMASSSTDLLRDRWAGPSAAQASIITHPSLCYSNSGNGVWRRFAEQSVERDADGIEAARAISSRQLPLEGGQIGGAEDHASSPFIAVQHHEIRWQRGRLQDVVDLAEDTDLPVFVVAVAPLDGGAQLLVRASFIREQWLLFGQGSNTASRSVSKARYRFLTERSRYLVVAGLRSQRGRMCSIRPPGSTSSRVPGASHHLLCQHALFSILTSAPRCAILELQVTGCLVPPAVTTRQVCDKGWPS